VYFSEVYNVIVVDAKARDIPRKKALSPGDGTSGRLEVDRSLLRLADVLAEIARNPQQSKLTDDKADTHGRASGDD
jgi:hypothetical protein